jgi:hypothetical protein
MRDQQIFASPSDRTAGVDIQQMEKLLTSTQEELAELHDELSHQLITAPADGVVIAPEFRPARKDEGRLPTWSGSPLDVRNRGATVTESDLLCRIGDPTRMEVVTDPTTGAVRPQNPSYPASVIMDDMDQRFQLGMKGQARVSAAWIPLGTRLYRYLAKTVRFEL